MSQPLKQGSKVILDGRMGTIRLVAVEHGNPLYVVALEDGAQAVAREVTQIPSNFIVMQGSAWWTLGYSHLMAAPQFENDKGFDWECAVDVEPWDDLTGPDGSPMEMTYAEILKLCQAVNRGNN